MRLGPRASYAMVAAFIGLALCASSVPSPLYAVYQREWGFSSFSLTVVFALYALGVLVSLLLFGGISDDVGRRPVLIAGLTGLVVTTSLFLLADSLAWLMAARTLQGLSTGLAMGAASAALIDLHPRNDGYAAGLVNGVVSTAAMGVGAMGASLLVQYAPLPEQMPYAVLLAGFAVLLAGAVVMPETVTDRGRLRVRIERPRVPRAIRRPFVMACLGVLASWSVPALYVSLGPELAAQLLHTRSHLAGGLAALALSATAATTQLLCHRIAPRELALIGASALAAGLLGMIASISLASGAVFLLATVLCGAGFGTTFLGVLRSLMAAAPDHHRAEVMSAFYVVGYGAMAVPVLVGGLVISSWGLETTFRVLGATIVVACLAVIVGTLRSPRASLARVGAEGA